MTLTTVLAVLILATSDLPSLEAPPPILAPAPRPELPALKPGRAFDLGIDAKDWQRVIDRLDAVEKTVEKLQKANAECEQRAVRQWYESPVLWFGIGAATVLVAGTAVVLIADKRAGAP